MVTRRELEDAIYEIEDGPVNYASCEKLAHLYSVYNHLYSNQGDHAELMTETIIGYYGDTDFLSAVEGRPADEVWSLIDELVSTVQIVNPRLYEAFMRRVAE